MDERRQAYPQAGGDFMKNGANSGNIGGVDPGAPLQGSGNPPARTTYYATIPVGSFRERLLGLQSEGFVDAGAHYSTCLLTNVSIRHLRPYLELAKAVPSKAGPSLAHVYDFVNFDRSLSSELMRNIGVLESRLRASYSFLVEDRLGEYAIYDESRFLRWDRYFNSMSSYQREIGTRARKDKLLADRLRRRSGKLPISEGVEYMSLGTLANFYGNTADGGVSSGVAEAFNSTKAELVNWLKATVAVRNMLARFEPFAVRSQLPSVPKGIRAVDSDRSKPFYFILLLMRMLAGDPRFIAFDVDYAVRLRSGVDAIVSSFWDAYEDAARFMGIPDGWVELMNDAGNASAAAYRSRMKPIDDE